MTVHRLDHVDVVVEDLAAAVAFFVELGLELEGEATVEGGWVDQLVGLDGVRADMAVVRTRTATAGSSCRRSTRRWPPALRRGRR
jgi:catechol 2,3-dioxygenase-like lactoylglutathione lyase family enzyme